MSRWLEAARAARKIAPTRHPAKTAKTGNEAGNKGGLVSFGGVSVRQEDKNEDAPPPVGGALPNARIIHLAGQLRLPTHPAACTRCSKADWRVAMRTADGRTWHVSCCKSGDLDQKDKVMK